MRVWTGFILFYIPKKKTLKKAAHSPKTYSLVKLLERKKSVTTTSEIQMAAIPCYWR
jgi:hypothetical protein